MAKRMIIMLLAVGLFFGGIFGWKAFVAGQIEAAMEAAGPPVATVSTTQVGTDDWVPAIGTVATLRSAQSVDVSAQLDGQITELFFDSGEEVTRGKVLVQQYVDDDKARLKALQADLRLAEIELGRIQKLVKQKLVPQSELDSASSRLDRVRAEVENAEAVIGKKTIRAPFDGRLGIRQVNLGEFIEAGSPIVRLESLDRLYADFKLPQQSLPEVFVGQQVLVGVDAWPGQSFTAQIQAIEPTVDAATRNISVRAEIVNNDGRLRPGMFGEVKVQLPVRQGVVFVPQGAITFSPFGNSVYVVDNSGNQALVRNVYVGTGETRGDLIEITRGLTPGEEIVTSGQMKLRDGAPVNIDNSVPVRASAEPDPSET